MNGDPYVSRQGDSAIIERLDPVLWGEGDGPLSRDELASFEANGFIIREGLFDESEVTTMLEELERLSARSAELPFDEVVSEPGSGVIRSIFRVHQTSPILQKLSTDPRLIDTARQVLGSDVYVHQSRINFKRAFDGRPFPWHSDFETWHMEDGMPRMRALSASVLLTENNPVNGPLMLIRGSHELYVRCAAETPRDHYKTSLRDQRYGVPDNDALSRLARRGEVTQALGPPGSVIFFDCNTMHGSAGNMSPYPRHNVFLVFNSVLNTLEPPYCGLPPRPRFLAERRVS